MLEVRGLDVYYGFIQALRGVSFDISGGEMVAVLGANGAGKSTLLGVLSGLYRPKKGEIILNGKSIAGKSPEYIVAQGISLVPERREIFNSLSVLDNLLLGAYHRYRTGKNEVMEDASKVLDIFPALKGREKQHAGALSGGLQQMLAIGRGLMARPALLLLDEPSAGLAPMVVREIMSTLMDLKKTGMAIILVEQNTATALKTADRALVLERGRLVLSGDPLELMGNTRIQQAYLGRHRPAQPAVVL
mgnify:CR=1 FL=1